MLTLVVRSVPVGVAYAIWAGLGIVLVSVAALVIYGQKLDVPAMLGMGLIVCGVVVIQLFRQHHRTAPGTRDRRAGCPGEAILRASSFLRRAHAIRYFHRRSDCRRRCRRPLAECPPAPPGFSTVLVESASLGGGQSMKSQGIIHGGTKYALHGALTGASEAIADMPRRGA
jgi:hypothetical protein